MGAYGQYLDRWTLIPPKGTSARMKHVTTALSLTALLLLAPALRAQQVVPASLSLDDAIEIARTHNPGFRQTQNDAGLASWNVRQAWGALLPQASANAGIQWQGSGEQQRGGSITLGDHGLGGQPSDNLSNYRLGLSYSLD
jgi:outer membrane protein TolC